MAANTPIPCTAGTESTSSYRQRKHLERGSTLTSMSDAAELIERSGQQARVARWLTTSRLLEELGLPYESLADLDRSAESAEPSQRLAREEEELVKLRALVEQTAAGAARVGAGIEDLELRTLCFALARTCQRTQSKIRDQQLWRETR